MIQTGFHSVEPLKDKLWTGHRKHVTAEIVRVNDLSSDAIVKQRISAVTPGDQVQTYIDVARFIWSQTLDGNLIPKNARPRTRPLKLEPELVEEDTVNNDNMRLSQATGEENQWFYITAGGGAATLLLLSGNFNISQRTWKSDALGRWGATVYAGMKYVGFLSWPSKARRKKFRLSILQAFSTGSEDFQSGNSISNRNDLMATHVTQKF